MFVWSGAVALHCSGSSYGDNVSVRLTCRSVMGGSLVRVSCGSFLRPDQTC
ncbi:hypothetical protein RB4001 [Rhodopirellula baltica SH 1]|uniref:Uncharacterized protein n=1 Tax=Rhodopirellula baltica (strain DSM 10527 / NCIMB 13988 / SH1) TaxID=243090 RepID=Q7UTA0_RHOBA|nr:hypothetical protein RB4001 [Rhodopirellula baltica SH 1]